MKLIYPIFLLFIINVQTYANSSTVSYLDLRQTIDFALKYSPDFDSNRLNTQVAELEMKNAKANLLPSLDFTSAHGVQDSSPRSTGPWSSNIGINLSENLFDNGVGRTNLEIAQINKKIFDLQFEDQKNNLCLDVSSLFLNYSLNVKLQKIQEEQFEVISKQFNLISKAYYEGIKTQNDFMRIKTQVSRAEIDLLNSKNNVLKSKQELYKLIGINLKENSPPEFAPIDFDSTTKEIPETELAIEDHYRYKIHELQKNVNELNANLVSRKTSPEILISSGIGYGSSNYLGSGQSISSNAILSWNAILKINYNFFDWGIRSNNKEIAEQKKRILNNNSDVSLLTLKSTLVDLKLFTVQAKKNFSLSRELLSLEKHNLDFLEREYRFGKVQYLDLITGLNNYFDAEAKYYASISDLQNTKYKILYHQGKLFNEFTK